MDATTKYAYCKTLGTLIEYHRTSEPTMYLCAITGLSVDDFDFEPLQVWFDRNDPFFKASRAMDSGGSFAGFIGDAYMSADSHNRRRLIDAFGDLFRRFMPSITDEA
jgi:hypothetical protein